MPSPWRASVTDAQSGHAPGTRSEWPQWWQDTRPAARCSTSVTSQRGHSHTRPQSRQVRKFDQPRRFSSTIAFSPRRRTSSSASRVRWCSGPWTPAMPTTSTGGSGAAVHALGQREPLVGVRALGARRGAAGQQHGAAASPRGARPPGGRRSAGRPPACTRRRAPRRPRSARHRRAARRPPTAGRRTRGRRRGAAATTRRSAPAPSGASAGSPRCRRTGPRSGPPSAA